MAIIIGSKSDDNITGTSASDIIISRNGDDVIVAGDGNDIVIAGKGDDTVEGGDGNDLIFGGKGDDDLSGDAGNDILFGGSGSDTITGDSGDDILVGGSGNDTLDGGAGDDAVFGGSGDDTAIYVVSENIGEEDHYFGGSGNDTLNLVLSFAESLDPAIQQDIQAYQAFLASNPSPNSVFNFTAFNLSVRGFEALQLEVVGVPPDAPLIVGNTLSGTFTIDGGVTSIGDNQVPSGSISGSTVTVNDAIIGNEVGSDGTMTVSGPGSLLSVTGGNLSVGLEGTGTLNIENGGQVVVDSGNQDTTIAGDFQDVVVGGSPSGVGELTISGAGSSLTTIGTDHTVRVGFNGGNGTLTVEDGGLLDTYFLEIGREAGSTGSATITGAGSTVIVSSENGTFSEPYDYESGFVRLGRDGGTGTLQVLDGGRMEIREGIVNNTDTTIPGLQLGRNGGTGSVLVDGDGSVISLTQAGPDVGFGGPFLQLGRGDNDGLLGGDGSMTISNDGLVELVGESSFLVMGARDVLAGGASSSGYLNINSGGDLVIDGTAMGQGAALIGFRAGTNGTVVVDGEGSSLTAISGTEGFNDVGTYGAGSLSLSNGGDANFINGSFTVGVRVGGNGIVSVDGSGSTLNVDNFTNIGFEGVGSLNLTNGGVANFGNNFNVGSSIGANGSVNVDGIGSTINADTATNIGFEGDGTLTVSNGGAFVSNLGIDIASKAGSNGTAVITGVGSSIFAAEYLVVGQAGAFDQFGTPGAATFGSLDVLDGATAEVANGTFRVGGFIDGTGVTTISGPGSSLEVNGFFSVGHEGDGTLNVTNGGSVSTNETDINIGFLLGSQGSTTVSGTGSSISVLQGNLGIGVSGTGSMRIEDGGEVVVDSGSQDTTIAGDFRDVVVGGSPNGVGELTITGTGSTLKTIGTDNTVRIGFDGGTGTLNVEDGGQLETIFFEVGRVAGSSGTATISGSGSTVIVSSEGGKFSSPYDYEAGFARLGRAGGEGTLNIVDGGRLEIREGITSNTDTTLPGLQLGRDGGSGTVVVDGDGSVISITQAGPDVGFGGPFLQLGRGDNNGLLGGNGSMTVSNDGLVELVGENSALIMGARDVLVGGDASGGILNINSGADVTVDGTSTGRGLINIGLGTNTTGEVNVDGAGSSLDVSGQEAFIISGIRDGSEGSMSITNGAKVSILGQDTALYTLGNDAGSTGNLVMDGAGSELFISAGTAFTRLAIGLFGEASATLTNGASIEIEALDDNYSSLVVGDFASATLDILSGSQVVVDGGGNQVFASFATQATGSAEVTVSGAGSLLAVGGLTKDIGSSINLSAQEFQGPATLTIENGGEVRTHSVLVGDNGFLFGEGGFLNTNEGSIPGVTTGIRIEGGTIGQQGVVGTFDITGDLRFGDYVPAPGLDAFTINVDVNGTLNTEFDVIHASGTTNFEPGLPGTINFNFGNSFAPTAGDAFEFLISDGGIINNPTLANVSYVVTGLAVGFDADLVINPNSLELVANNNGTADADADIFFGSDWDEQFDGGIGDDALMGGGGNDSLRGGSGSDIIDGGTGSDIADYSGQNSTDFTVDNIGNGNWTITEISSGDVDVLTEIELVRFDDVDIPSSVPNSPPVVTGPLVESAFEDDAAFTVDLLSGASDPDPGETATLGVANVTGLVSGVTLSGNMLMIDPMDASFQNLNNGDIETIVITYDIVDINGASTPQMITVTINGVSDGPPLFTSSNDTIMFDDVVSGAYLDGTQYDAGDGNDIVFLPTDMIEAIEAGFVAGTLFEGGNGNDNIVGGGLDDNIDGGIGNDTISGGAGDDILDGGAGVDNLNYTQATGSVTVDLEGGTASGAVGNDTLSNFEILSGSAFGDQLFGSNGNDQIRAGNGADFIDARGGNDLVFGRGGDDIIDGGAGLDRVSYGFSNVAVTVDLLNGVASGGEGNDQLFNFEQVVGSQADDTLIGDNNDNFFFGQNGNDTIFGGDGNDGFEAQNGDDQLFGENGNDSLNGGAGNDLLDGGADIDTANYSNFTQGVIVDLLLGTGTDGVDTDTLVNIENITGSQGDDTIIGDNGDNLLFGGFQGDDIHTGNGGADTFSFSSAGSGVIGNDIITDFQDGIDTIRLLGTGITDVSQLNAMQVGTDTLLDVGGGSTILLENFDVTFLDNGDFTF